MDIIRCIDETFDFNATLSYHLYIQIGLDSLTLCVLNSINNKFIALNHYPFDKKINPEVIYEKYEELLKNDELLDKDYKSVNALYNQNNYCIIPNELFDVKNSKLFYEYNYILNDLDELHYSKLKNINATVLFSVPNQFSNPLHTRFSGSNIYSKGVPFIEKGIEISSKNLNVRNFLLQFESNTIDIIVTHESKLILQNSFYFNSDADILFYLHNIAKQLNWSSNSIEILCSGDILKSDSIVKTLLSYFKSAKLQSFDKETVFSYTFNKVNLLQFFNLLNLYSCV